MFQIKITAKKKGFTLIELMLVTSIILVLMGFMIPKFSTYHEKVKEAKAINIAKQIETAAMASYGYNDGKFVTTDVQTNITTLTSLKEATATIAADKQSVVITYTSDEKEYTLTMNAKNSSYILNQGSNQVFPKVSEQTTIVTQ